MLNFAKTSITGTNMTDQQKHATQMTPAEIIHRLRSDGAAAFDDVANQIANGPPFCAGQAKSCCRGEASRRTFPKH